MRQQVFDLPTLFCTGYKGSNGEPEKKGIGEDGVVSQSCRAGNTQPALELDAKPFQLHFFLIFASPGELMPLHRILNSTIQQI